jgi:hypothetical protein
MSKELGAWGSVKLDPERQRIYRKLAILTRRASIFEGFSASTPDEAGRNHGFVPQPLKISDGEGPVAGMTVSSSRRVRKSLNTSSNSKASRRR